MVDIKIFTILRDKKLLVTENLILGVWDKGEKRRS